MFKDVKEYTVNKRNELNLLNLNIYIYIHPVQIIDHLNDQNDEQVRPKLIFDTSNVSLEFFFFFWP